MTLEEVLKSLPFNPEEAGCKNQEEFIAAAERHLAVVAVKAEAIGEEELTDALDTFRSHFRKWAKGEASPEEKALTEAALSVIGKYTDKIRFPEE